MHAINTHTHTHTCTHTHTHVHTHIHTHTAQKLSGIQCIHTDLEEDPNSVREEFSAFLLALLTSSQDRQEQEEQGIINTQH